jgi:hypothetical protein
MVNYVKSRSTMKGFSMILDLDLITKCKFSFFIVMELLELWIVFHLIIDLVEA